MKFNGLFCTAILPVACAALFAASTAHARVWTDALKRTWEGDFVRVDGANAVFMVRGQEYPFPLASLSIADRTFISNAVAKPNAVPPTPAAPAATGNLDFLGVTLQPGKTVQAVVKLPPAAAKEAGDYYKKESTSMKVAVAVPEGFDPSKPQRLLIASASTSGAGLSINSMGAYTEIALARGWIVMATDGEFGKPTPGNDNTYFRCNMTEVLMDLIAARWPRAKATWSVAFGGISCGAGYASFQATAISSRGWPVTGMVLMNSSYGPLHWVDDKRAKFSPSKMHKVPIFVSGGESDKVQTLASIRVKFDALKRSGFKKLRLEVHPGAHTASKEHIGQALEWFESLEKETKSQ